jgi:hypothetical protein
MSKSTSLSTVIGSTNSLQNASIANVDGLFRDTIVLGYNCDSEGLESGDLKIGNGKISLTIKKDGKLVDEEGNEYQSLKSVHDFLCNFVSGYEHRRGNAFMSDSQPSQMDTIDTILDYALLIPMEEIPRRIQDSKMDERVVKILKRRLEVGF